MVLDCKQVNSSTTSLDNRVESFATLKPGCECESDTLSEHSPGLIKNDELIVRMVVSPMHISKSQPNVVKPNFLSHSETKGVSMQRLPLASTEELANCVNALTKKTGTAWLGFAQASAENIRNIGVKNGEQVYCVADAALEHNKAHAEIHLSRMMPEADRIEYRSQLRDLFLNVQSRKDLYDGKVWDMLDDEVKERVLPQGFIG